MFTRFQRYTVLKKRVQLDGITNAERAFVFKLFLCNPFARSAGIFLRAFISVKQFNVFTRFYALLRAFISVKQFISLLRSGLHSF